MGCIGPDIKRWEEDQEEAKKGSAHAIAIISMQSVTLRQLGIVLSDFFLNIDFFLNCF